MGPVPSNNENTLLTSIAYGRRVGLRVLTAEVEGARAWLPFWWNDAQVEPEQVWTADSADSCQRVVRDLELWVAEHAVDVIFVHAGVVAIDGEAILIPGRSYSGKSTLVAALLRAGATYGSDEYAVIDPDGLVHSYPRPLSLRNDIGRPQVTAAELGAATLDDPVPVRCVAMLRYEAGNAWQVTPLSPATTVLRLLDNTVAAQTRGADAVAILAKIVERAIAIEGHHGNAKNAAQVLIRLGGRRAI
jgi:hypothetical protein